ncbi:hypothetical protein GTW43_05540, partial [Streptomyces sp. SID5785]|uniref:hypothetical protein n=1 Tax=Streptomyces sp. SID5785 TaxID=2690309 RepID=UPI0013610124
PATPADLAADPGPTAGFLLGNGVPVTPYPAPVQALFGRLALTFTDDELREMLRGGLLLDGVAAHVLTERGFADLIGVRAGRPAARSARTAPGPYAIEQVSEHPDGSLLSVDVQPALARLHPLPGTRVLTRIRTPDGQDWGVGRCHFVNRLGGRTAVLAATAPSQLPGSDEGQRLLHTTVRFLEGDHPVLPLVDGGPHLVPHATRTGDTYRLATANGGGDPADVRVRLPAPRRLRRATLLAPLSRPTDAAAVAHDDGWALEPALPHRGWAVFEW